MRWLSTHIHWKPECLKIVPASGRIAEWDATGTVYMHTASSGRVEFSMCRTTRGPEPASPKGCQLRKRSLTDQVTECPQCTVTHGQETRPRPCSNSPASLMDTGYRVSLSLSLSPPDTWLSSLCPESWTGETFPALLFLHGFTTDPCLGLSKFHSRAMWRPTTFSSIKKTFFSKGQINKSATIWYAFLSKSDDNAWSSFSSLIIWTKVDCK